MNQTTLDAFPEFIVTANEASYEDISNLTPEEHRAYQRVSIGKLLLEQEKVPHSYAVQILSSLVPAPRTFAGPPFLTDDPEPVDYHHWENYLFATGDDEGGAYTINGPAVEINYGPLPDTQLSLTAPLTTAGGDGAPTASGLGDVQLGIKYRFLHETNGWPQMAFYPAVTLPTGDASRGLGNGRAWVQLPLWAQKSWGAWTTYGGGGVNLNSAPGHRDNPFGGWLVQRDFGENLSLGGEFFAQGRDLDSDKGFVAVNFGGEYRFTEHFSVLASAGHSIAGQEHTLWYFAIGWDW
jgi:hypothetical protein